MPRSTCTLPLEREQAGQVDRLLHVQAEFEVVGQEQLCPIGWKCPPMTP